VNVSQIGSADSKNRLPDNRNPVQQQEPAESNVVEHTYWKVENRDKPNSSDESLMSCDIAEGGNKDDVNGWCHGPQHPIEGRCLVHARKNGELKISK